MSVGNDADLGTLEVIDKDECFDLLRYQGIGRIAFHDDAKIVVFPINYQLIGHAVVFLTGDGSIWNTAIRHKDATFEVDESDGNFQTGWSVMVSGKLRIYEELTDQNDMSRFTHRPWAKGAKQHAVTIEPHAVTGRVISHGIRPDIRWNI